MRIPQTTGGEGKYSERISSSCSTSDTHCFTLITNPEISQEWWEDKIEIMTNGTVDQVMKATVNTIPT